MEPRKLSFKKLHSAQNFLNNRGLMSVQIDSNVTQPVTGIVLIQNTFNIFDGERVYGRMYTKTYCDGYHKTHCDVRMIF